MTVLQDGVEYTWFGLCRNLYLQRARKKWTFWKKKIWKKTINHWNIQEIHAGVREILWPKKRISRSEQKTDNSKTKSNASIQVWRLISTKRVFFPLKGNTNHSWLIFKVNKVPKFHSTRGASAHYSSRLSHIAPINQEAGDKMEWEDSVTYVKMTFRGSSLLRFFTCTTRFKFLKNFKKKKQFFFCHGYVSPLLEVLRSKELWGELRHYARQIFCLIYFGRRLPEDVHHFLEASRIIDRTGRIGPIERLCTTQRKVPVFLLAGLWWWTRVSTHLRWICSSTDADRFWGKCSCDTARPESFRLIGLRWRARWNCITNTWTE